MVDQSRRRFIRDAAMFGAGVATTVGGLATWFAYWENEHRKEILAEDSVERKDMIAAQIDNGLKGIEILESEYPGSHQVDYLKNKYLAFQTKYNKFLGDESGKELKGVALVEHVSKLSDFNQEVVGMQIDFLRLREMLQEEKEKESLRERL